MKENYNYDFSEIEKLYKQRELEHEESVKTSGELRAEFRASIRIVANQLQQVNPKIIEYYGIKVPAFDGNDTLESLSEFVEKMIEVEKVLGYNGKEYLRTLDTKYLKELPPIYDKSSLDVFDKAPKESVTTNVGTETSQNNDTTNTTHLNNSDAKTFYDDL